MSLPPTPVIPSGPPPSEALDGLMAIYGKLTSQLPPAMEEAVEGAEIGHCRLCERIAEGGMGVVWRAEQLEPVHREVAVKILKHGMDTAEFVRRFHIELEALARLEHPNIARVYDAGMTPRGRPFLVMELVREAAPVTDFCRRTGADLRARLELFAKICATVQFAHQRGVIHRDLKPSNLLVSCEDGVPRPVVIDFGVARAAGPAGEGGTLATEPGRILGTPAYMSPEQAAAGEAATDTRSDVYALGCVLYELITGQPPFDHSRIRTSSLIELARLLHDEHPPTPSDRLRREGDTVLAAKVRGELNWIVMKALAKDPAQRYPTAAGLEDDVRRYLRGDAVNARPASVIYRLRKFAARHKPAAAATLAALLSLVVMTGVSLYQARREARERQNAEAILRFFDEDLVTAARLAADAGGTADPLDAAARRVDVEFSDRPVLAARLRTTLGRAYLKMGDPARAGHVLPDAWKVLTSELGAEHPETLRAAAGVAEWKLATGETAESERLWRSLLPALEKNGPGDEALEAALGLARALGRAGKTPDAIREFESLLARARRSPGGKAEFAERVALTFAAMLQVHGDLERADFLCSETLARRETRLSPDHPETLAAAGALAGVREASGEATSALTLLRRSFDGLRTSLGAGHPKTLAAQTTFAEACERLGDEQTALSLSIGAGHALAAAGRDAAAVDSFFNAGRLAERFHVAEYADRYRATAWDIRRRAGLPMEAASLPRSRAQFFSGNGHWYQRIEVPMSWTDAAAVCRELGGYLATSTSGEENTFLHWWLASSCVCWLGGYRDEAGRWGWVTGEPFVWAHWGEGEPSNSEGLERYLNFGSSLLTHFRKQAWWNDHQDSGTHSGWILTYPICEWDPPAVPPPSPAHTAQTASLPRTVARRYDCNGHWYARINIPMSWAGADTICRALGGRMACPRSSEENEFLFENFATDRLCWIGASDGAVEGQWTDAAGTPLTYAPWTAGEPNNSESVEHYAQFGSAPYAGIRYFGAEWNDADADGAWLARMITFPICEWDSQPALQTRPSPLPPVP
jgi:tetratricopeptide (TPR) repeat protein